MDQQAPSWPHTSRVQSHDGGDTPESIPMIQITGGWLKEFGFEVKQPLKVMVTERRIFIEVMEKD